MKEQITSGQPLKLDAVTRLAFERTRQSYDRTVMSAVRTATSLITFGFTVYKFFQFELKGREVAHHVIGPREFGLTLVIIGLFSLAVTTFEYRRDLKALGKDYPNMPRSSAGTFAAFIAGLGVTALIVMVFRR